MLKRLISNNSFLVQNSIVCKLVCMFDSTNVCEYTFSSNSRHNSKYRDYLSQENLKSEIRYEFCKNGSK